MKGSSPSNSMPPDRSRTGESNPCLTRTVASYTVLGIGHAVLKAGPSELQWRAGKAEIRHVGDPPFSERAVGVSPRGLSQEAGLRTIEGVQDHGMRVRVRLPPHKGKLIVPTHAVLDCVLTFAPQLHAAGSFYC